MYGFSDKAKALFEVNLLRVTDRINRYEVLPHHISVKGVPLTWGVARYVPYCPQMPERFDGFVWFEGVR